MSETHNPELGKYAEPDSGPHFDRAVERLTLERQMLTRKIDFLEERFELPSEFEELPDDKISEHFSKLVERLSTETGIIEEIDDTVGRENLLRGLASGEYPIPVEFDKRSELKGRLGGLEAAAVYDMSDKKIMVGSSEPSPRKLWRWMATEGIPDIIAVLDHEIEHHWFSEAQKPDGKVKRFVTGLKFGAKTFALHTERMFYTTLAFLSKVASFGAPLREDNKGGFVTRDTPVRNFFWRGHWDLLSKSEEVVKKANPINMLESFMINEVVAQKTGNITRERKNQTSYLVDTMKYCYGVSGGSNIDKVIVASQVIDRLRALGLNDRDAAELMANSKYDKKTVSFPDVEAAISEFAEKKGLSLEDIDTMADIRRMEKRNDDLKVRKIALEEMKNLVDNT